MSSPHSLALKGKMKIKGRATSKCIPSISDKTKYALHYRSLKHHIKLAMELSINVHYIALCMVETLHELHYQDEVGGEKLL